MTSPRGMSERLQEPFAREFTDDQTAVIVKAVVRAAEFWGLTNAEGAALFDVPTATWSRMKAGTFRGRLDQDKTMRASLIVGIFRGLGILYNGPLTHGWPKRANTGPLFNGQTPIAYMIENGIPGMAAVRQQLDALQNGL